jgi:hypothetical protein
MLPILPVPRRQPDAEGFPETVRADPRGELRETLGFSRLAVWMNSGGQVSHERVMRSMRLFAERVMPRLAQGSVKATT